jgi:subtilase family serine protease
MKHSIQLMVLATALLLFGFAMSLPAQESAPGQPIEVSEQTQPAPVHYPSVPGTLIIPESSKPQPVPAGHRFVAHTNIEILIPAGVTPEELPPFPGFGYETPASLACVYGLTTAVSGCNPNSAKAVPTGGSSNTIAIVDAYDDPSAPSDLAYFSLQFGLPITLTQFQVVWANTAASSCFYTGVPVDPSGGWETEESLDIEWAHAMAPKASIYLVEACSGMDTDMQQAVLVANNLVNCGKTGIGAGGALNTTVCGSTQDPGEVSLSWGSYELPEESTSDNCATLDDSCFTTPYVVYVAAAGDTPGTEWPGTSPNVVSAGGLSNRRNPSNFNFVQQSAWVDAGGGQSQVEAQPSYQSSHSGVTAVCGTKWRCVPDVSFDADPFTGVYVYDSFPVYGVVYGPWWVVGGTSLSAPAVAGIINRAGSFAASSNAELTTIYNNMSNTSDFTDIKSGYCGPYMGFTAVTGWDFCTGVGAVNTYAGK